MMTESGELIKMHNLFHLIIIAKGLSSIKDSETGESVSSPLFMSQFKHLLTANNEEVSEFIMEQPWNYLNHLLFTLSQSKLL